VNLGLMIAAMLQFVSLKRVAFDVHHWIIF